MLGLYLSKGLAFGLYAASSPGPLQAYLFSQSLKHGWRRTLPAAFAPLLSDGPIIALVLLVLTQTPTWFLDVVKLVGGGFILWLAWQAWRSFRRFQPMLTPLDESAAQRSVLEATVMNLLNPNPYIFWGTVGGVTLLEGWRLAAGAGLAFLFGFYGTMVGGSMALVLLSANARQFGPRVNRALLLVSVGALLLFGLYQLGSGLSGLWNP